MSHLLQRAQEGDTQSQLQLGECYLRGENGVEKDSTQAIKWFSKASDGGLVEGETSIANMYYHGLGVERDFQKAMNIFLNAAERGCAEAMCCMGDMYSLGQGVTMDYIQAMEWYVKAAKKNNPDACYNLGEMYVNGDGVEIDEKEAFEWFLKAAELDWTMAKVKVGQCYRDGIGVDVSYEKAMEWFDKAADDGDVDALYEISLLYEENEEDDMAVDYQLKAAELGHVGSMVAIGFKYQEGNSGLDQDYEMALEWFFKASSFKSGIAMWAMGTMFNEGLGVKQDFTQARKWFEKAYDFGYSQACYNIGLLFENGLGVEKDVMKAIEWYSKDEDNGLILARLYYELDIETSAVWYEKMNNNSLFKKVDDPVSTFGLEYMTTEEDEEDVNTNENGDTICSVKLKDTELNIPLSTLLKCDYFKTMLNENWKDSHHELNGRTILDLQQIQYDIIPQQVIESHLFAAYFEYLQSGELKNNLTKDQLMYLLLLGHFLNNKQIISAIFTNLDVFRRWYVLHVMNVTIELVHSLIFEVFILKCSETKLETFNLPCVLLETICNCESVSTAVQTKIRNFMEKKPVTCSNSRLCKSKKEYNIGQYQLVVESVSNFIEDKFDAFTFSLKGLESTQDVRIYVEAKFIAKTGDVQEKTATHAYYIYQVSKFEPFLVLVPPFPTGSGVSVKFRFSYWKA